MYVAAQVALKQLYPELALRLMRCTRTDDHRVNKKGKKYRAALGEAGVLLKKMTESASFRKRHPPATGNAGGAAQSPQSARKDQEEHRAFDSVRLSNLEEMMMEQGRVLATAVNSLAEIRSELQMISLVNKPDEDGAQVVSGYRAP
eukprot:COSAG02_NODE_6538_length_3509_cov_31.003603_2_plen_146_part_00